MKRFFFAASLVASVFAFACSSSDSSDGGSAGSGGSSSSSSSNCTEAHGCINGACACKAADGSLDANKPCCGSGDESPNCTGKPACSSECKVCK